MSKDNAKTLAKAITRWGDDIHPDADLTLARAIIAATADQQFEETGEEKPVPGSPVDASMEDPAVSLVRGARSVAGLMHEDSPGRTTIVTLCREVERLVREKAAMQTEADRHLKARAWAEAELATARERNVELENDLADAKAAHATAILGQRAAHEEALFHIRCALDARNNESALDAAKRTARELADSKAEADAIRKARVSEWPITSAILEKRDREFVEDAAARVVRERDDARWMAEEAWRWAMHGWRQLALAREIARHAADDSANIKMYRAALSDADAELSDVGWRDSVVHGIRMLKSAHEKGIARLRADLEDWRNKALEANREAWTTKQRLKSIVACAAADDGKGGAQ